MQKNLYIGVLLAPYRVDFYNYLHDTLNFEFYFQLKGFQGQLFDSNKLIEQSTYTPYYLKSIGKDQRRICFGVRKIIKKYSPKVIITPEFSLLTIWVIILRIVFRYDFKIISQCDDSYQMLVSGGFSKFHDIARNFCIKHIDELILVDDKAMQWYHEKYNKGIWMPIIKDESCTRTNNDVLKHFIDSYKVEFHSDETPIILFVGRLIEVKNLGLLLHACSLLKENYHLLVVGDGPMLFQWQNLAKEFDINCTFLGRKNDEELVALYSISSIFVLPSTMEPFGAVTNEALLAGCYCCISCNAGSACLINDGENGYTINPYDCVDLARQLSWVIRNKKNDHKNKMIHSFKEFIFPLHNYISNI